MSSVPSWRVSISDDCIASGMCVALAPRYFALGDDGKSHPINAVVEPDDVLRDAAGTCPMEAITIQNAATGEPETEASG